MRYLMVLYVDVDRARAWEQLSPSEQEAEGAPLHGWYEENAAAGRIVSGQEAAWPRDHVLVRPTPAGPSVEYNGEASGRALSGVMVIEVDDAGTAIEMARTWPDLRHPGDQIELVPIRGYDDP